MLLHIDVLGLLHKVWGALAALSGASLVILAIGMQVAIVQLGQPGPAGPTGSPGAPQVAAVWILATFAGVMLAFGGVLFLVGRGVAARRSAGRSWAMAFAVPNLLLVPFGTALGIYTFWVLLNDDARRAFGRAPQGA